MITLISTPAYYDPADLSVICRWLATESPNNFRLLRRDWLVTLSAYALGYVGITVAADYTGLVGNNISLYDQTTNSMYTGKVSSISPSLRIIITDIPWVPGMVITYMNDSTMFAGYYFEGRLIVNNVVYPLTIIASPDTLGYADLDVSGILRIVTSLGKVGDYTQRIMKETTKSGKFNFEFREKWYRSTDWDDEEGWEGDIVTFPPTSPPLMNDWYYGESVRSEEQGSNLHDYHADILNDAPFLNLFTNPVYFLGLPFDLSFILPDQAVVSPESEITVTINFYSAANVLLRSTVEIIPVDDLEGYICSLNIGVVDIPYQCAYLTAEITV